jgi:hypothetical protein
MQGSQRVGLNQLWVLFLIQQLQVPIQKGDFFYFILLRSVPVFFGRPRPNGFTRVGPPLKN